MSLLTENEKIIIQRLRQSPNGRNYLANVIDRDLSQARIRVDKTAKKAFILVERNYFNNLQQPDRLRIEQIVNWVTYVISISFSLVDMLEKCGFVSLRQADICDDIVTIGPGLSDENAHKFEIEDSKVVSQLVKYIDQVVTLSEAVDSF
jgi:hypothetical protein